jgi:integrase/recombinase XerD
VYNLGLDEFIAWFQQEARPAGFTKATVTAWRVALEARNSARSRSTCGSRRYGNWRSRRQTKDCSRRNWRRGLLRIKGVRSHGVRAGNWLSLRQAQALLNAPDVRTKKGLRDRAMFATLLGCGLRRSELANLTMKHVQQRDNRWCIVDLVGKHGRVPTIPMPAWVKNAIDAWTAEAAVTTGHLRANPARPTISTVYFRLWAPTAQGMVSERCGSALISFEETVTRPFDGYNNGYNRYFLADE